MTEIVTVYEAYDADGDLVDVTGSAAVAEAHSVEDDRRVFAETTEVPMT